MYLPGVSFSILIEQSLTMVTSGNTWPWWNIQVENGLSCCNTSHVRAPCDHTREGGHLKSTQASSSSSSSSSVVLEFCCYGVSPRRGGLEWLVGAAVSLSLRAVSCLSYVPEGSWAACHTYRRAPELLVISTIVVLSCCHAHGRAPECTCLRTIGILSAPACAPEGCWVHLLKYHYDTTPPKLCTVALTINIQYLGDPLGAIFWVIWVNLGHLGPIWRPNRKIWVIMGPMHSGQGGYLSSCVKI